MSNARNESGRERVTASGDKREAAAAAQPRTKRQRQKQVEVTGYVEKTLKERVRLHGQREGLSESEIVRNALREFFFPRNGERLPAPYGAFADLPPLADLIASAKRVSIEKSPAVARPRRRRHRRQRGCSCSCACCRLRQRR